MNKIYSMQIASLEQMLRTNEKNGLAKDDAKNRLIEYGYNKLLEKKGKSPLSIFLEQFKNFIVWVLIAAAMVSGFLQEWIDAAAIIIIVVLNAVLGFVQEYRAEKSLEALKKLSSPTSKVIRGGKHEIIPSSEIVPGDLVELEAGDNVPADSRLVYVSLNFATQEASLTGESLPVVKTDMDLGSPDGEKEIPLAERANMVYMGTYVVSGRGRALVVDTGMKTELGKIAVMIQGVEEEQTPLQRKLDEFGKWIVFASVILVVCVFLLEVLRGGEMLQVFLTAVSLAVAAIPEGLPAVVTIALALGVSRMVKRNALVRKLPSVETLGRTTVICSDKTGTLTKNEMTVQAVYADNNLFEVSGVGYGPTGEFFIGKKQIFPKDFSGLEKSLLCGILCNGAELVVDGGYKIIGDPTEGAILTCAAKMGLWKNVEEKKYPFVEEIPFDSVRMKMTIVRKYGDKFAVFVKGAPDSLLNDCKIDNAERAKVLSINNDLTNRAMRVLAVAYKELDQLPDKSEAESIEKDLIFLGLIAMIDPPREEVKASILECRGAGIKTVMITGDHKNTATAIARELGFFSEKSKAMTGEELDSLNDLDFNVVVDNTPVYARVSPENKLRIIKALRRRGEVVAMTGDGVNDAPALKESDIGVAMGITGTDVTKEVSDMIITDDNFASIVSAVREGRGIYDNIKKFVHYLLSCNVGEILVMFISSLVGFPVPLLPIQILWINLATDGLPALALGVDPVAPNIMERPPRSPKEPIITRDQAFLMLFQGMFIAFCSLAAFTFILFVENEGLARARTAAFCVLAMSQLFHSFSCRSNTESIFKLGLFSNINLVFAVTVSFLLQLAVVSVPLLQRIFKTEYLSLNDWLVIAVFSSLPLWAMEAVKLFNKMRGNEK